ncbi:MAG: anaerobic ribonucleoside-triphosphate reductase activating protein [Desulfobacterales bacterium]|nr:anaerobic ribonucleoside-triphosphate reductase activating protein [Desulfobacterales bacterium]
MFFGGIQKNSLIDYPGKVSCVLFLSGCNFACPYCHNPDLARGTPLPASRLRLETAYEFLEKRRGMLDGVVLSGGEPTLEHRLIEICTRIKAFDYSVKLDTNGSRPDILARLFDADCLDYVAMDIKTPPALYTPVISRREVASEITESIHLIMSSGVDYEFRTTCARPFAGPETLGDIARSIKGARKYVLQKFNPATVLEPGFFTGYQQQPDGPQLEQIRQKIAPLVEVCTIR